MASDQCLQCLLTGFSIENRIKATYRPDTFKMTNGLVQHIIVEESTSTQWVKLHFSKNFAESCSPDSSNLNLNSADLENKTVCVGEVVCGKGEIVSRPCCKRSRCGTTFQCINGEMENGYCSQHVLGYLFPILRP